MSIEQRIRDEIVPLVNEYAEVISRDHHKTKDGYFYINLRVSAYDEPSLMIDVSHLGYINEFEYTEDSLDGAVSRLRHELQRCIADVKGSARWQE